MFVVNKDQTRITLLGNKELVTEASDINLPPGHWPNIISVVDNKNEGFLFHRATRIKDDGGYQYWTKDGRFGLTVFND